MDDYKATVEVRPVARSDEPIIVTFDLAYSQLINLVSLVILEGNCALHWENIEVECFV